MADTGPAVTAETIELQAAKTPNDIRDNFEFGSTDLVYCDPNSPAAVGYRCDYEAWEAPTPILHYVGFNLYSGWFTNGRSAPRLHLRRRPRGDDERRL